MESASTRSTFTDDPKSRIAGTVIVYVLFLGGLLTVMFPIVGAILSHFMRKDSNGFLKSHFSYLIRTFWISASLCFVIGLVTFIGFFVVVLGSSSSGISGLPSIAISFSSLVMDMSGSRNFRFTIETVLYLAFVATLVLGFVIWYLVRLGKGVRALYLGREAPL
ncbi:MAG: hypothetical protein OXG24_06380 [Gammaproteobacteria bacterium]|nr:hypothetical protein [Gammaproteobacteria bacterium]